MIDCHALESAASILRGLAIGAAESKESGQVRPVQGVFAARRGVFRSLDSHGLAIHSGKGR